MQINSKVLPNMSVLESYMSAKLGEPSFVQVKIFLKHEISLTIKLLSVRW